ncbi:putative GPR1/FUN34/yaaH family-domain-containing protein [Seiridium unicorne]|uniref:GPR1/FUN34/yaaH family-domain-containing protein n=1 Tax=Seiridium unicorne TaxID=138068 RepID=A0ABR2VCF2_9PEZI
MSSFLHSDLQDVGGGKPAGSGGNDIEKQATATNGQTHSFPPRPRSLGAGTALPIGVFATTLTTLSLSLMEWRGVTTTNVFIANFFFAAAFGLVVTAQWELSIGNGFSYTVFSAFGLFYAGYGAILTPAFGVAAAYGDDTVQYNNALGFFVICMSSLETPLGHDADQTVWTVFVLTFLVASLPTNLVYIGIFFTVDLGFLLIAAQYFAEADGNHRAAIGLKKTGGVFCFIAGLIGWYLTFALLLKDSLIEFPLGDTSRYFGKSKKGSE